MYGYLPRFISDILQLLSRIVSILPPPLNDPEIFLLTVIIIALASAVIVVLIKGRKQPETFEIPGLEEAIPKPSGKVEEEAPPKPLEGFEVQALPPPQEPEKEEKEEKEELPFWIREKLEEEPKPSTTDVQDLEKRLEMALRAAEKPTVEEKPPEEPSPPEEKPPEEPSPPEEKPPEERFPLEIPTPKPLEEFKPAETPKPETKPVVTPSIEPEILEIPELTEAEISYLDSLKNQLLSISSKVSQDKEKGYIGDTLKDKILSMIREDISNIDKIIAAAKIKLLQRKKRMIEMEYKERFKEIERQLMELRKQLGM